MAHAPDRSPESAAYSETRRQLVHLGMGVFALLLRVLTWWQAALCAAAAFLFNLLVLPKLGGRALSRPIDRSRGYPFGILVYPVSVLLLILALPTRLDLAAAGWGILAAGDSLATLVGRRLKGRALPWNARKTVAGSVAFAVSGVVAGAALALWVRPSVVPLPSLAGVLAATAVAAIAAALVESLPVGLDDNISVPISAGLVLWSVQFMTWDAWIHAWPDVSAAVLPALLLNVPVAALGWLARTVSPSGAGIGALIGMVVFVTTGAGGWALLFASFFVASASSKLGLKRKSVLGIAEERQGRRGPGNAIANCGLAAWAGILAVATPHRDAALLAFVAALAAGGSDTVASEIGKAWGRRTWSVTSFARVRPGTSGAVSLEGTAAGLVAALGLAAVGQVAGLIHGPLVWLAAIGAFVASWVESALGATLEAPGILDNDLLNFINTTVAAIVAVGTPGGVLVNARFGTYDEFARPFTLVAPALGFVSGGITAAGAAPREPWSWALVLYPLLGALMAAVFNAGNNALNQIFDYEIDRINKPKRPLPSGRLTFRQAWAVTVFAYLATLALAWLVAPGGRHECFWIVLVAIACTIAYSVPPLRTKRLGVWANVTIAIPRGVLLKVAGWSSVKSVLGVEPWFIGAIFGLFLLGATTTKDFADMEGDRLGGCRTLPIVHGVTRAAWMISPSFVAPFLMIPIGAFAGILTGSFWLLQALGAIMTVYGVYVCYLMLRRPEELAIEENHVSWAHMYRMMFVAQIGFALAYVL